MARHGKPRSDFNTPLNDTNFDYRVNVLVYTAINSKEKRQQFSWITKIPLTQDSVYELMRAGRSRWRIENETFNTLKNQGYHFSHNYGHGYKNLCSVVTMLMLLAFLIDQVRQLCCSAYQKARKHVGTFSLLFEKIRVLIEYAVWTSFTQLLTFIGDPASRAPSEGAAWLAK